jgi:Ca2+-transporting ATPase
VIGAVSFGAYRWMLEQGWPLERAHNGVLLLMVLFLNIQVGNARSERRTALALSPLRNPFLLFGTLAAQGLHIAAMYTPGLRSALGVQPVSLREWVTYLGLALTVFVVVELHGLVRRVRWPDVTRA